MSHWMPSINLLAICVSLIKFLLTMEMNIIVLAYKLLHASVERSKSRSIT